MNVTTELLMKGFMTLCFSLSFSYIVFSQYDNEIGSERADSSETRQRYLPYLPSLLLPILFPVLFLMTWRWNGLADAARVTFDLCIGIFLHICLYYAVLMILLPFFRRHISARACAMLWVIPNYLYLMIHAYMEVSAPILIIPVHGTTAVVLCVVWLAGFTGVMGWKIISHLIVRRQILRDAFPVTDPAILTLWQQELESARFKRPKYKLVISPQVSTPLSIGLFHRSIRVVLPQRHYTPEELTLIIRHELIHIGREDSQSKFFLAFCTAICWFNPLMWMAMKKSADDLELSCDETVLLDCTPEQRKLYARLILDTAGEGAGFTTCLSAAASTLRYRLTHILQPPRKRSSGALAVGAVFFLLCMTCGYVTVAYEDQTAAQSVFASQDLSAYELDRILRPDDPNFPFSMEYDCVQPQQLTEYIASLRTQRLYGNYSYSQNENRMMLYYNTPDGTLVLTLTPNGLRATRYHGATQESRLYYLPDGLDQKFIDAHVLTPAVLTVNRRHGPTHFPQSSTATLTQLIRAENGERTLIRQRKPGEDVAGVFGGDLPINMSLDFSLPLASPFRVEIESWDRTYSYTIHQNDLEPPYIIPLPSYSAHYKVYATLVSEDNSLYEAVFQFEFGNLGEIEP